MRILMTGATGFIGQKLALRLFREGHDLVILSRSRERARLQLGLPCEVVECDLQSGPVPAQAFANVEAVINLAGEPIAGRWSAARKKQIHDSRFGGTKNLVAGMKNAKSVKTFLSTSAVGYYGDRKDEILTEDSTAGSDFLAHVCLDWEAAAREATVRTVIMRVGVVLGHGGALSEMRPIFNAGLGATLGSGNQWMSWIHIDDLVEAFVFALHNKDGGVCNLVAANPVTNKVFTKSLAKVIGKSAWAWAPSPVLRVAMGEMSSFVLSSARVQPTWLEKHGFQFKYTDVDSALKDICSEGTSESLNNTQFIARPLDEVFRFFSEARNLETITPPWLNFKVVFQSTPNIEKDTEIEYRLKIHGVPVSWRSKIVSWEKDKGFVDTQLKGPYSRWNHQHTFESFRGGTLMHDSILYRVPAGRVGELVAGHYVRSDVQKIFQFRKKKVMEIFG